MPRSESIYLLSIILALWLGFVAGGVYSHLKHQDEEQRLTDIIHRQAKQAIKRMHQEGHHDH